VKPLVHRQPLLDEWRKRLAMFVDLPINDIGQIVADLLEGTLQL
jgi:hypothetical protein